MREESPDFSHGECQKGAYKSRNVQRNLVSAKRVPLTIELVTLDVGSAELADQMLKELELKGKSIDIRDLFIGCIALSNGFTVVICNKENFQRIPRLHVIEPAEKGRLE